MKGIDFKKLIKAELNKGKREKVRKVKLRIKKRIYPSAPEAYLRDGEPKPGMESVMRIGALYARSRVKKEKEDKLTVMILTKLGVNPKEVKVGRPPKRGLRPFREFEKFGAENALRRYYGNDLRNYYFHVFTWKERVGYTVNSKGHRVPKYETMRCEWFDDELYKAEIDEAAKWAVEHPEVLDERDAPEEDPIALMIVNKLEELTPTSPILKAEVEQEEEVVQ